jgi:uncharacterized membrane protein required for colicin V production
MNKIVAAILAIMGGICLFYVRSVATVLASFFAKQFHKSYGAYATERGWDDPNSPRNKGFYTAAAYFIGIF